LPCFNEERNLQSLVSKIDHALNRNILYQIIAVNDGSEDYTVNILRTLSKEYPIEVIGHERNMGLATALRTGLYAAIKHASDDDLIVTMDADNTHEPTTIVDMAREMEEGADIAVGSRYEKGGKQLNVPPYRILLSKTCNFIIGKIAWMPVKDATSGFRCYRASALKKPITILGDKFIQSRGFGVSLEILVKTYLCASVVKEIPTTLHYGRKLGDSKMNVFHTITEYLRLFRELRKWRKTLLKT
jgi:dolichol-phosphate mannosyltransferase